MRTTLIILFLTTPWQLFWGNNIRGPSQTPLTVAVLLDDPDNLAKIIKATQAYTEQTRKNGVRKEDLIYRQP